ncbi:hypothetical protein EYB53_024610 [Candidatus Chloroploca sp. M-50]|uniref:Uncharacterized protein n=1 Tax=Candidatus Chloroploca mongolica TaxID=2528176 RepID=A0ABS4DHN5_9CHLR|nr:hypothetical protein [Candidatus Chloroploca mongolica]MBP1468914.1 hypothetical protein [Candidatus Chloroploca mongolica]
MEDQQEALVFLAPEIQELLADNQISLEALLRRQGVDVQLRFGQDPTVGHENKHKDPVTIIVASSVVIAALTPLLVRAFETLAYKPVVVREQVIVPVEDSQGNVVRDAQGNPLLQWVDRTRVIETSSRPQEEASADIKGPLGISIKFKSTPKG